MSAAELVRRAARALVPARVRRRLRRVAHGRAPVGWVDLGDLRRLTPLSERWGFDRGTPVDRHYIEAFLRAHACDIRGDVLEVKEDLYATRFGGAAVSSVAVLDYTAGNPRATIVADLAAADRFPASAFDTFLCTQTLQYLRDLPAAARTCHRLLREGGVFLGTVPALSRLDPDASSHAAGEYWRFTPRGLASIFDPVFGPGAVEVRAYGNVLAGVAFLHGLALEDLTPGEIDHVDPAFPVLVAIAARKRGARPSGR